MGWEESAGYAVYLRSFYSGDMPHVHSKLDVRAHQVRKTDRQVVDKANVKRAMKWPGRIIAKAELVGVEKQGCKEEGEKRSIICDIPTRPFLQELGWCYDAQTAKRVQLQQVVVA